MLSGKIVRVALINNRSVPTGVWFYPPTGGGRRSPDALDPGSSLSADVPCQSLFVFVIPQTESEHAKSAVQSHPPDGTVLHRVPVTQAHAQKIVASRPVLRDVTAYQFRLRRYGERPEYSPGRQYYVSRTEEVAPAATREWFSRAVRADEDGFDDRECLIPRLRNSSTDEFQERCVHASRPCLLQLRGRDVFETETEAWMPPEAWSRKSFSTNHGGLPVRRTFGSDLTRGAFLANFESASERETLAEYLSSASDEVVFEYGCPKCDDLSEALRGSWSAPRVFEGPRKKRLVSIGGDGASLNFHAHGAAWLLLVHGKKQWYLAPSGLLTEEELADSAEMRELDRSRLRARRAFQARGPRASIDSRFACSTRESCCTFQKGGNMRRSTSARRSPWASRRASSTRTRCTKQRDARLRAMQTITARRWAFFPCSSSRRSVRCAKQPLAAGRPIASSQSCADSSRGSPRSGCSSRSVS